MRKLMILGGVLAAFACCSAASSQQLSFDKRMRDVLAGQLQAKLDALVIGRRALCDDYRMEALRMRWSHCERDFGSVIARVQSSLTVIELARYDTIQYGKVAFVPYLERFYTSELLINSRQAYRAPDDVDRAAEKLFAEYQTVD